MDGQQILTGHDTGARTEVGAKDYAYVCVCVSVCPSGLKVCFFSVISWPILILFVLSDMAWSGLQNFYTEF